MESTVFPQHSLPQGHNLTVDALVNDTVGTLVARRYEDKKARLGIILGMHQPYPMQL